MLEETECIFEHINQSSVFSDQAIFPACTTDVDTYVYLFPAVFGPLFILRHRDRYIWGAHYALWYSNRLVLTKRSIAREVPSAMVLSSRDLIIYNRWHTNVLSRTGTHVYFPGKLEHVCIEIEWGCGWDLHLCPHDSKNMTRLSSTLHWVEQVVTMHMVGCWIFSMKTVLKDDFGPMKNHAYWH